MCVRLCYPSYKLLAVFRVQINPITLRQANAHMRRRASWYANPNAPRRRGIDVDIGIGIGGSRRQTAADGIGILLLSKRDLAH